MKRSPRSAPFTTSRITRAGRTRTSRRRPERSGRSTDRSEDRRSGGTHAIPRARAARAVLPTAVTVLSFFGLTVPLLASQECIEPCVGPPTGALLLAGGGELDASVYERFVALAGGEDAHIFVVPTASRSDDFTDDWIGLAPFRDAGAGEVHVLHTRQPETADSEEFAAEIRRATGVWFTGGRPWRLVDAYDGTRAEDEFLLLLARGGVVGGNSAGASIVASYLIRGAPIDNDIVMAPGYETGFGFLQGTAIDQHLQARGRENDLFGVLHRHPHLLGIGLDEGAAIVVREDKAEVIGRNQVAFYDSRNGLATRVWLLSGDVYDLRGRLSETLELAPPLEADGDAVVSAETASPKGSRGLRPPG